MFKVSVMYPYRAEARFDHEYYRDKHMPMVQRLLGPACAYYTVDKGVSGSEPGSPPAYVGMCHIFTESLEVFGAAMEKDGKEIFADVPTYTDIEPVLQVSEVVVGH